MTSLLEVQRVSKSFGGLHALSDVSFEVGAGEIFAVIGPNGAGKTTLFNCLAGAATLTSGAIRLGGQRIDGRPPHEICRRGLARTFQLVKPFRGMTVLENVKVAAFSRYPSTKQATAAARAVLDRIGMAGLAEHDAETLNVAQLRQLEIARALATEPQLLLLDEMLAGLTPTESTAMCERIRQLPRAGIAVIVVEHSIPVVTSLCARAVVLCFGKVLTQGSTCEVIANPRVQEAYLGNAQS
ncbi:ABC transporter ATP-binding protein [Steroidobacter agaridevorans]|uniref:ABC transporter ATP-binding protein n=1 Tax=Steroidobacter agaridevorans TaxID=2695856 RepID=UPI00132B0C5A|nr:ABC transporter ATP-binding protein [Steroidobacter agaridevorans]GFE89625.1 ABC transporter ATP-binding protein [Steroidobacter agaridevorans]